MNKKRNEQTDGAAELKKGSLNGSVTIYLALMLLLSLVLVFTLIESGRVRSIEARLRGITYMGLDSVFSEYAKPVFEQYGVMMLWCKDDEFIRRMDDYLSYNLDFTDISLLPAADLYQMSHDESILLHIDKATDENGTRFEEQVYEYMKYYLAESAAEELLKNADIVGQGEQVKSFMDKIDKRRDVFRGVEQSVERMQKNIEKAARDADGPVRNLEGISDALGKYERTDDAAFLNEVYIRQTELLDNRYKLGDTLDAIGKETERYHKNAADAQAAISELEKELQAEAGSYTGEVRKCLQTEIDEIRAKSGEQQADYYLIEKNLGVIDRSKEKLNSLDNLFPVLEQDIGKENVHQVKQSVDQYKDSFRNFDLSGLELNYTHEKTEKESSRFLDEINALFQKGVLDYVAPDYSKQKADLSTVPSGQKTENGKTADGLLSAGLHKAMFSEYLKKHFGRYTEKKEETALAYETEYILGGKASDKDNLRTVIDRIILIRSGLNMISLLTDTEKKAEALALATAITGFTGMPVLIKIMQLVILSAWALAESMVDAKILFQGEKVPIIKKPQEWSLSLTSVKNFSAAALDGKGAGHGLAYEDYLRMLLLAENRDVQVLRTMDIIQLNMMKNENPEFRMKDCIMGVETEIKYHAPSLFVRFPFVIRYTGSPEGEYAFIVKQSYAY